MSWAAYRTGDAGIWRGCQAAAKTSAAQRERCAAIVERWNATPTHDWLPAIGTGFESRLSLAQGPRMVACHDWST
jgi:hypothetical protein